MGLHREATYKSLPEPGMCRRIWWHLANQDTLQSLCYGRPSSLRMQEVDVNLPTLHDFAEADPDNELFLQRTKLCKILGSVSEAQYGRQQRPVMEQIIHIGESLRDWIESLRPDLRLYDPMEQRAYRPFVYQLHIMYFTGVILFYRLVENCLESLRVSVVAASAIATLFEEIYYRGDIISLLPINNWYCMVASVPLVHALVKFPDTNARHREDLAKVRLALQDMRANNPSSALILANVDRVQRSVLGDGGNGGVVQSHLPADASAGRPAFGDNMFCAGLCHRVDKLRLFPFPASLCPSMDLLCVNSAQPHNPVATPPMQLLEAESDMMFNFDLCDVQLDPLWTDFERPVEPYSSQM
ncbi:hypothetical protein AYO21_02736 [Fonsecaea monophora]|uniref:Xylanolytic transcriptional activator regulatory domain-containing protein n=1 Tax=Fonsecaea monophora TaxID=254056 RepID=A0A177FG09_9EURO|nr:hypothetical protein AYO21_02736 [Fonsecaea monophora]OAG43117.1 hypothetical protein AYO21_02736 [Fonsecaea monophora]